MSRDLFDPLNFDEEDSSHNGELPAVHNKIELEMVLHYDTERAVQVSDTGEEARAVWLPKSQIQLNPSGKKVPSVKKDGQREILPVVTVLLPEWLAKNKGLI